MDGKSTEALHYAKLPKAREDYCDILLGDYEGYLSSLKRGLSPLANRFLPVCHST